MDQSTLRWSCHLSSCSSCPGSDATPLQGSSTYAFIKIFSSWQDLGRDSPGSPHSHIDYRASLSIATDRICVVIKHMSPHRKKAPWQSILLSPSLLRGADVSTAPTPISLFRVTLSDPLCEVHVGETGREKSTKAYLVARSGCPPTQKPWAGQN